MSLLESSEKYLKKSFPKSGQLGDTKQLQIKYTSLKNVAFSLSLGW